MFALLSVATIALLLLAAHFVHAGILPLAVLCILLVALLAVPRRWAARTLQVVLGIATIEWALTATLLAQQRAVHGEPFLRLLLILGSVTVFTAVSALLFEHPRLRRFYNLRTELPTAAPRD
jgi:hypothetical protein